ncbi:hypothetical protein MCUN1_001582 [Malassezia cuniculi]|uniref:Inosine/uridine-preferring nucleoside hydrolase domain-containing protein n=1 Tax=Malassezia cuniculi TaxID=948313 RepID=A0AAF0J5Z7_9BASI|nr:hypothetical protein MCUN1_001582 [Malassezia cuniculi]
MHFFSSAIAAAAVLYAGVSAQSNNATGRPKVIMDNDWSTAGFIPYLMAVDAGWDILGLVSDTANSWALQCGLHALATLERGNLSCIPVHKGADYPMLNTPEIFQTWELLHGELPWQGAFAPENTTFEKEGNDPTSGDPKRIVREALHEGYPNTTFASNDAAWFMIEQVRKYPGEISIYSAGALTNIALAVRMDPDFARNTRELVIMGGYIDVNLLEVTGGYLQADINSDINLKIDPEGSKIALSADFPNITVVGNAANQIQMNQEMLDEIHEVSNVYTDLVYNYYTDNFPAWDETAAAVMLDPSVVTNSTNFYIDVGTSFHSPTYGNIHAYQKQFMPKKQKLREVNMIVSVDEKRVKHMIKHSVQHPKSCQDFRDN